MIRAYWDTWSDKSNEAEYESPIAKLIWQYIDFTDLGATTQFKLNLGDSNPYKTVDNAFHIIRKEVRRICQLRPNDYGFPKLQESFDGLRDFDLPDYVIGYISEVKSDKLYIDFCHLLRYIIFATYLNYHIATTVVVAPNEDDAFDMFESLNTTGELLTAYETFKPKVIEREGRLKYKDSDSYQWITEIEEYLNRYTNPKEKQRSTSEMLIHFALSETGKKLEKPLNYQRKYLHYEFDKLSTQSIEESRFFVRSLAKMGSFLKDFWFVEKNINPDFASLHIDDEETLLGFQMLRELKHTITIAPLYRFYFHILDAKTESEEKQRKDDFVEAIKATVTFSVLWRGAMGDTRNIDSHYREILRNRIPN